MRRMKIDWRTMSGYGISILVFAIVIIGFVSSMIWFSGQTNREGTENLRNAIRRASVQCYAIEGRYPPSIQYLQENYGIQIDVERYSVFYSGFASNVMPDITVVEVKPEE